MAISGLSEEKPVEARRSAEGPVWTRGAISAILLAYAAGFGLTTLAAGPWQATRDFAAEGLILFLWLLSARLLLRGHPVTDTPVRRPGRELIAGFIATIVLIAGAWLFYRGQPLARYLNLAII